MSETTKITLLRGCVVNGEPHKQGDTVDATPSDARYLIGAGSAAPATGKKEKAPEK